MSETWLELQVLLFLMGKLRLWTWKWYHCLWYKGLLLGWQTGLFPWHWLPCWKTSDLAVWMLMLQLCHSLPPAALLACQGKLILVAPSSHWGVQSVLAVYIFRCFFLTEGPAWPINNNPVVTTCSVLCLIYILKVHKDQFLWIFDVWMVTCCRKRRPANV